MADEQQPQVTGMFSSTAAPATGSAPAATSGAADPPNSNYLVYRTTPSVLDDVRILGYLIVTLLLVVLWLMTRLLKKKDNYKPGPVFSHDPTYSERENPRPRKYGGTSLPEAVVAQWDTFSALQSYNAPPAGDPGMLKEEPTENNLWAQMFAGETPGNQ